MAASSRRWELVTCPYIRLERSRQLQKLLPSMQSAPVAPRAARRGAARRYLPLRKPPHAAPPPPLIPHQILNIKTFAVKFLSAATAVGSGLPVGPEGPMIHMGAIVGAGLSQGHSTTLGIDSGLFRRFQVGAARSGRARNARGAQQRALLACMQAAELPSLCWIPCCCGC